MRRRACLSTLARRHIRPITAMLGLMLALLLLAGCGAATTAGGHSENAATPTPTKPGIGKTSVRGCPGPYESVGSLGNPALVLTLQQKSGAVRTGDLVRLEVPADMRWNLTSASANLALVEPGGVQDSQRNVCVWSFRARASGNAAVELTGAALCDQPDIACPQYAEVADFSLSIS
ncbi:MAG TPA: hypothetical protein VJN88_08400 [Ktedonobacterales bacterium]|nr:hypothetical protein [Ktedonobacterales bacterium]